MNRKLPSDFHGEKYGLSFRLVNEGDAKFIYKLRSDPQLSKFIHDIEGGVEQQKIWISKYKEREKKGIEYYFIFFKDDVAVGLFRIYDIHDNIYTCGSWVMEPNSPVETVLAIPLIIREMAFDDFGMVFEDNYDAVHVDNKKVIKFNQMFGCKIYKHFYDVKGEYVAMSLTKEDFEKNRYRLARMCNSI